MREVRGFEFNNGRDIDGIMDAMSTTGYQSTSLWECINEVNRMIDWRLADEKISSDCDDEWMDQSVRENTDAIIFLGYTSNIISSGLRETIRYLAQNNMIDVIVTTAGGIEEDIIKCLAPTYLGDFQLNGRDLRLMGLNRVGNLIIPNENYCIFEDWIMPILDQMYKEQEEDGVKWTPSLFIHRLGKEINHEDSVYFWCFKNRIPVFCPGLTDGSIGDMLYLHAYKRPGLIIDIVKDITYINEIAVRATPRKTGVMILGGGLPKHHILNANLMRNGSDFCAIISTGTEFDGSDSGARPDEAISWGKIKISAKPVKAYGDATILFPLLVSQTFARNYNKRTRNIRFSKNILMYLKIYTLEIK